MGLRTWQPLPLQSAGLRSPWGPHDGQLITEGKAQGRGGKPYWQSLEDENDLGELPTNLLARGSPLNLPTQSQDPFDRRKHSYRGDERPALIHEK